MIEKTFLKKKLVLAVIGAVVVFGTGAAAYSINTYVTTMSREGNNTALPATESDLLPEVGKDVNVTINNNYNPQPVPVPPAPEAESESLPPPLPLPKQASTATLMEQPPAQQSAPAPKPQPQPKFLYTAQNSSSTNNGTTQATNAITGTDTSIGTGNVDTQYTAPVPNTIRAGSLIPITMRSGLISDVRGQIIAIVNRDVYDTTTGQTLLIPQGSQLVGTYDNNVAYGINRMVVGWNVLQY